LAGSEILSRGQSAALGKRSDLSVKEVVAALNGDNFN